jgi:hypothetical protein
VRETGGPRRPEGASGFVVNVTHLGRADDLAQVNVHPRVAVDEVAIVRLAVLELDQLFLGGGGVVTWGEGEGVSERRQRRALAGTSGNTRGACGARGRFPSAAGVTLFSSAFFTHHRVQLRRLEQRQRQHDDGEPGEGKGGERERDEECRPLPLLFTQLLLLSSSSSSSSARGGARGDRCVCLERGRPLARARGAKTREEPLLMLRSSLTRDGLLRVAFLFGAGLGGCL